MKRTSNLTKLTLLTTLTMIFCGSLPALAQEKKAETTSPAGATTLPSSNPVKTTGSDKVDLKKLEDKYWSAKDDEYGVIQNRTFAKSGKFYLSLVYGPLINDSYAKARATGGLLGYYLNEDWGIELNYFSYNASKNNTVSDFQSFGGGSVNPNYNLLKSTKALALTYTPFYAKMAFMNTAILYFDMGFTLGIGQTDYEIQKTTVDGASVEQSSNETKSAPHVEFGVMQQLFLSQYFAFRLDIKNSFYTQKSQQYKLGNGLPESSRPETSKSVNDTTITFGLTVFTK